MYNYLNPTRYELTFSRLPNLVLYANRVSLPGLNIGVVEQRFRTGRLMIPGSSITYDPFTVNFHVDESMDVWRAIADWIKECSHAEELAEASLDKNVYSDVTVEILTNNSTTNQKIIYENCFPTNLTQVELDATTSEQEIPCSAMFSYTNYKLV